MDILAEDLGTTEIIKLFGERLKTAREKNIELERGLAAKTIECDANLRRAQQSDENRAALRQELHRVSLKAKERQSESSTKQEKTRLVEELTERLRVKSETEKEHLEALAEMQNALAICKQKYKDTKRQHNEVEKEYLEALEESKHALTVYKQKYKDAKRQLAETQQQVTVHAMDLALDAERQIDRPSNSLGKTIDFVAKFASAALPNQLEGQIKRQFIYHALLPSDIQDHMAKERPPSHFHCFSETMTQSGAHHWLVGTLHRIKFPVEQQHWKKAEWTPHPQFKKLHGKTIEVFREGLKGKIVYLGRHKAIPLQNLHSNQFQELPKRIRRSLVDSVISQTGWTQIKRVIISSLLICGTIQMECLGLQFDGFDKKLNASMEELARQRALLKNAPGSLGQRQVKKRKIDEVDSASNGMAESTSDVVMEDSSVKADSDSEASEQEYGNGVQWG